MHQNIHTKRIFNTKLHAVKAGENIAMSVSKFAF